MSEPTLNPVSHWLDIRADPLDRIYAQLKHLASLPLPTPFVQPSAEDLRSLIEVAFWASLRSNEERPTRVRIALHPRQSMPLATAFANPVDFDVTQIAKLAHVVPVYGSLLVCPEGGRLRIWGFSDDLHAMAIDGVAAEIAATGVVRLNVHMFRPYAVFREQKVFFLEGGAPVSLPDFLRRAMKKELPREDFFATQQAWRECLVLAALAGMIVEQGHGGTILVVPDSGGGWEGTIAPFPFKLIEPDVSAQNWIRQGIEKDKNHAEAFLRVASSSLSDEDKATVQRALASPPWQPREALRCIALQANCDGAIIVTKDLQVLGFGAKIVASGEGVTELCRIDPIPGPQRLYSCSLEDFGGTRHQSAVKFVAVNKDAVAIVVSQDRRLSLLHWSTDHNCVMAVQHAEWWI